VQGEKSSRQEKQTMTSKSKQWSIEKLFFLFHSSSKTLAICAAKSSNRYLVASFKNSKFMEDEGEDPLHIIGE
jgi:hypothetical protein